MRAGVFCMLLLIITSCGLLSKAPKPVTVQDYIRLFNSSDYALRDTVVQSDVRFMITGITKEADCARMVLTDNQEPETVKNYYDTARSEMSYEMKILLPSVGKDIYSYNPKSAVPVSKRTEYFAFLFKNNVTMITQKNDTLECSYLLHERGMSGSPVANFIMEFVPLSKGDKPARILIKDDALTGETITFDIARFNTAALPKLRFD